MQIENHLGFAYDFFLFRLLKQTKRNSNISNCKEILNWKIYFLSLHASYLFSERYIKCQFEIQQMWMDSSSLR